MVLLGMYVCDVEFAMVATGNLAASGVEDCDQRPGAIDCQLKLAEWTSSLGIVGA